MYYDDFDYDKLTEEDKAELDAFMKKGKARLAAKKEVMDSLYAFVDHAGAETMTNCSYFQRLNLAVKILREFEKEEGGSR